MYIFINKIIQICYLGNRHNFLSNLILFMKNEEESALQCVHNVPGQLMLYCRKQYGTFVQARHRNPCNFEPYLRG